MSDKENPLVSVIIPCYKQAHFLSEAIESVLRQTYRNVETIVIDDGSPDNTSEVAARYAEVKCVRQENRGLSGARNRGIAESKGEYLVFLDADDRLLPHALESHLECLLKHPECAFVYGHHRLMALDGSQISPQSKPRCPEEDHYFHLLQSCYIYPPGAVMFRRGVLDEVGFFNESQHAVEDWELYLRIARQFSILCHHQDVIEYRIYEGSMSTKASLMFQGALAALKSQKKYVQKDRRLKEAFGIGWRSAKEIYGERVVNSIRCGLRKHDWKVVAQGLYALLRWYPQSIPKHVFRKIYCLIAGIPSDIDSLYSSSTISRNQGSIEEIARNDLDS
ncbi:glycosyltransferase [Pyrinomonas methylaliphatogenes]|uniref:Glycosyl transferase n=1 Tax=Pyrinomonas methylaliphatogenes TaxID=454194 RepID=A0A0B6X127_9BACT|nr:glycosyltransferase [Pyrinomonas methylaliphatogenes]CDM66264.1 glycosyl transferase [Pyrinomonas methylaliphatogenes]